MNGFFTEDMILKNSLPDKHVKAGGYLLNLWNMFLAIYWLADEGQ